MAGNATVTLYSDKGSQDYEIWLVALSTATQNEFMTQQLHAGVQWIPIRRSEMFINFTAIWPLVSTQSKNARPDLGFEDIDPADGFGKMNKFQDEIRKHQVAFVQGNTDQLITLNYYNNSNPASPIYNTLISQQPLRALNYTGMIQTVEKQYTRFQNVFYTNYSMNIKTSNIANTPETFVAATDGSNAGAGNNGLGFNYAPTTTDQERYGSDWLNIDLIAGGSDIAVNMIRGIPG